MLGENSKENGAFQTGGGGEQEEDDRNGPGKWNLRREECMARYVQVSG